MRTHQEEQTIIDTAIEILHSRIKAPGASIANPRDARDFLRLNLGALDYEVFWLICLDAQQCVISAKEMFRGTLGETAIYVREIVREALLQNGDSVMVAHCHPSGSPLPSPADIEMTAKLKAALKLVDVTLIDHLIVSGVRIASFADLGLL